MAEFLTTSGTSYHIENVPQFKQDAIKDILIRLTYDGAFRRANIYKKNISGAQRDGFRKSMASLLPATLNKILAKEKYDKNDHFKMIESFSQAVSKKHSEILNSDKLRIGNAQKFLNLYWKISWLLEKNIRTPIHCPFDSIVIKKLDRSLKGTAWTQFDSMDVYKKLVVAAEEKAGAKKSIAEWELRIYREEINYREK